MNLERSTTAATISNVYVRICNSLHNPASTPSHLFPAPQTWLRPPRAALATRARLPASFSRQIPMGSSSPAYRCLCRCASPRLRQLHCGRLWEGSVRHRGSSAYVWDVAKGRHWEWAWHRRGPRARGCCGGTRGGAWRAWDGEMV